MTVKTVTLFIKTNKAETRISTNFRLFSYREPPGTRTRDNLIKRQGLNHIECLNFPLSPQF